MKRVLLVRVIRRNATDFFRAVFDSRTTTTTAVNVVIDADIMPFYEVGNGEVRAPELGASNSVATLIKR